MRVTVDPERCMGHGQCYAHAPQIYEPDAEGYCVVVKPDVDGDDVAQARKGAQACPESAITVSEDQDA
ncbi:MAG: ferredoxin [Actinomycetota bacterium]|nr:ferredoxin [Actinomycetota bacterium]